MTSEQYSGTDWYALSALQSGLVVSLSLAGALLGSGECLRCAVLRCAVLCCAALRCAVLRCNMGGCICCEACGRLC